MYAALPQTPSPRVPRFLASRRARAAPSKRVVVACGISCVVVLALSFSLFYQRLNLAYRLLSSTSQITSKEPASILSAQLQESTNQHYPDAKDTFGSFKYRSTCNISSIALHTASLSLCPDRQSLLSALSSGGRVGFDAPYVPRGCDMQWFTGDEVCSVLGRFSKVLVVGDSLMRHVVGSLNVLLRKDLGYGAVTDWNFDADERKNCFCNSQFNVKSCSMQGIFSTADVLAHDPESLSCANPIELSTALILKYPIPAPELLDFREAIPATRPEKPIAFAFGHGLWNDLDVAATATWLDTLLEVAVAKAPWLAESKGNEATSEHVQSQVSFPRLFISPNAAGVLKPDQFIVTQGNKALALFEESTKVLAEQRGMEHLGTWNMSIQATKFDGSHLDLKGNLVKAMMVVNWLAMLDVKDF